MHTHTHTHTYTNVRTSFARISVPQSSGRLRGGVRPTVEGPAGWPRFSHVRVSHWPGVVARQQRAHHGAHRGRTFSSLSDGSSSTYLQLTGDDQVDRTMEGHFSRFKVRARLESSSQKLFDTSIVLRASTRRFSKPADITRHSASSGVPDHQQRKARCSQTTPIRGREHFLEREPKVAHRRQPPLPRMRSARDCPAVWPAITIRSLPRRFPLYALLY